MVDRSIKKMPVQKVQVDRKASLILQLIMTFITTVFIIVAFFQREYFVFLEFLLGLDLFVLAFNNFKYYKRRFMSFIYLVAGVAMVFVSILKWCGIL